MKRGAWLSLLLAAAPLRAEEVAVPRFVEETGSGIDSVFRGEWQYMVGGGVATFDCDNDGMAEVFIAGGENPATFYRNRSTPGGSLRFAREAAGLEALAVTGAWPGDFDGDGHLDLMLLRVGENLAMRGDGTCRFSRANEAWGYDGGDAWSTALAATWEAGASWPTLAVGNYIDRTEVDFPWGSCTENWLHRPAAGGSGFGPPVALSPGFCALSMLFTDWNRSG
ncbi:VCBS repeat-containing protein, partial [Nostoc sp. CHAB 5834]|nr:VCBS repeat-containing protein [Nostoc sp. CHAB 5834]